LLLLLLLLHNYHRHHRHRDWAHLQRNGEKRLLASSFRYISMSAWNNSPCTELFFMKVFIGHILPKTSRRISSLVKIWQKLQAPYWKT